MFRPFDEALVQFCTKLHRWPNEKFDFVSPVLRPEHVEDKISLYLFLQKFKLENLPRIFQGLLIRYFLKKQRISTSKRYVHLVHPVLAF